MTKIETFYMSKLIETGFEEIPPNGSYSPLGKFFSLSSDYGKGTYWIYNQKDLYDIKVHDFSFHKDTVLDIKSNEWPECLNIMYYESISGVQLIPYRHISSGCITTYFGGDQPYNAIIHKTVPVRSIGIEILPGYYDQYLKNMYADQYINPQEAFRAIDATASFPEMEALLCQIWNYRGDGMPAQLFYDSKIAEAISLIISYNQKQKKPKQKVISKQDRELLSAVASYINDHYHSDISFEQLSHIACMGTTKLRACFKQLYGCTITEYIKQRRLSHAESLLSSVDFTIEQIAKTVGYSNAGRFASDFKNSTGLYPAEYRKMALLP